MCFISDREQCKCTAEELGANCWSHTVFAQFLVAATDPVARRGLCSLHAAPVHGQALCLQMIHGNTNKELWQPYFIPKTE